MWSRPTVSTAMAMDVNATYLTCDGTRVPGLVSLAFDPLDPVAVTFRARVGDPGPASLTLARELFTAVAVTAATPAAAHTGTCVDAGCPAPLPDGDGARVEPLLRGGRRLISISLPGAGGGRTAIELSATRVVDFVRRSYELVPREAEAALIDLDLDLGLAALGCG